MLFVLVLLVFMWTIYIHVGAAGYLNFQEGIIKYHPSIHLPRCGATPNHKQSSADTTIVMTSNSYVNSYYANIDVITLYKNHKYNIVIKLKKNTFFK